MERQGKQIELLVARGQGPVVICEDVRRCWLDVCEMGCGCRWMSQYPPL